MQSNPGYFLTYGDFLSKSRKKRVRPGFWRWKDVEPQLTSSQIQNDFLGMGRGAISFAHQDVDGAYGICSSLNMLVQSLAPGAMSHPHHHSNFAIFIVKRGWGYSMIDEAKIEWEEGDVFFAPCWARHYHKNTSETDTAILYTIQDVPTVANIGLWLFKGSSDDAAVQRNFVETEEEL